MYKKSFYITRPVSNNFFSFEKRKEPKLFVPPLIDGNIDDARVGNHIVFEDFDDNGILRSCKGLEQFIKGMYRQSIPFYIFDNHNHAFAFWHKEMIEGNLRKGTHLVHIDAHKDTRQPEKFLSLDDASYPQKVFEYTNTTLNVGNFIPAAWHTLLVKNTTFITSQSELETFDASSFLENNERFILDIDLDFFAPELDYINNRDKVRLIQKLMGSASVITFATSPFFIDQELALYWLRTICA